MVIVIQWYTSADMKIKRLVWDERNIAHISKYKVRPEEVIQVCRNKFIVLNGHSGRLIIVGITNQGRPLAVILDPEPKRDVFYPVTARSADRKERRKFITKKGAKNKNDEI